MRSVNRLLTAAVCCLALATACDEEQREREPGASVPSASAPPPVLSAPPPAGSAAPPVASAPPEPEPSLVLLAGGDVNLGRETGQAILADPDYNPFENLAPLLAKADLRFVNLESQLSDQNGVTQSPLNRLIFSGPPGGGRVLARAGIDVVSIANNHAWDYQKSAFLETLDNLTRAGVGFAGGSAEPNQQYQPYVFRKNGWSVALFAVTHIWNQGDFAKHAGRDYVAWARYDRLHNAIKRAKREHDLVIVSYHGGGEYIDVPLTMTRDFVKAVMKAGVDVVLGHHPHVVHGVGWFDGRPAFYSLGNLVFNLHKNYPATGMGFLARLSFRKHEPPKVEACPFNIVGHTPELYEGKAKEPLERAFRQRLKFVSITVGGTEIGEPGEASCMELSPPKPAID